MKNWCIFWFNPEPTLWIWLFFFFLVKQDVSEKSCWKSEKRCWKRLCPYSGDSFFTSLHCAHMLVSPFWIITSWTSYSCIKSISNVITSLKSFLSCFLTVSHVLLCLTWLSVIHFCQCGGVVICSHLPHQQLTGAWDSSLSWARVQHDWRRLGPDKRWTEALPHSRAVLRGQI